MSTESADLPDGVQEPVVESNPQADRQARREHRRQSSRRHGRHRRCPFCHRHLRRRAKPVTLFESLMRLAGFRRYVCRGCRQRSSTFIYKDISSVQRRQLRFFFLSALIVALCLMWFNRILEVVERGMSSPMGPPQ